MNQQQTNDYFAQRLRMGWAEGFSIELSDASRTRYAFHGGSTTATVDEQPMAITADSRFCIGSVAKTIVAALIIKLVETGQLSLNDPLKRYIPEYKHATVTLQHLLEHTAGYAGEQAFDSAKYDSTRAYLQAVYEQGLIVRPPNEQSAYFSPGYTILCDVIERVSEQSLQAFATEVLFAPVGMSRSTFFTMDVPLDRMVLPRWPDGRAQRELIAMYPLGEGVLYACTADLLRFGRLFLNGGAHERKTIFHERTIQLMLNESTDGKFARTPVFWRKGDYDRYGCFGELHSPQAVGHTGYSGCMLWVDPACNLTAALLSNSTALHQDWANYRKMSNVLLALSEG